MEFLIKFNLTNLFILLFNIFFLIPILVKTLLALNKNSTPKEVILVLFLALLSSSSIAKVLADLIK